MFGKFKCGHPKSHENTVLRDGWHRCRECRLALERRASAKYRARVRAPDQWKKDASDETRTAVTRIAETVARV